MASKPLMLLSAGVFLIALAASLLWPDDPEDVRGLAAAQVEIVGDRRLARGPVGDTQSGDIVWTDTLLSGTSPFDIDARLPLLEAPSCTPSLPKGESLVRVAQGSPASPSDLYGLTPSDLDDRAEDFLRQLARLGEGHPRITDTFAFGLIDVVVTEAGPPVHLVLISPTPKTHWRIHPATGVDISGITLLAGRDHALSGVPDGIEVEAWPDHHLDACNLSSRLGRDTHPHDTQTKIWAETHFGIQIFDRHVGFDAGSALLLGPVPPNPIVASTEGLLRVSEQTLLYDAHNETFVETMSADILNHARTLAGGDFDAITGSAQRASVFEGWSD